MVWNKKKRFNTLTWCQTGLIQTASQKSVFWHIHITSRLILESLRNKIKKLLIGSEPTDRDWYAIPIRFLQMHLSPDALNTQIGFQCVFCVTCNTRQDDVIKSRVTEMHQCGWAESMLLYSYVATTATHADTLPLSGRTKSTWPLARQSVLKIWFEKQFYLQSEQS